MPNSSVGSALTPGFGWAPSLPHLSSLKFSKEEISNMMLRAKCGIKGGDVQKEAHMLFYMGIVNENKKNYKKVEADEHSRPGTSRASTTTRRSSKTRSAWGSL